MNDRLTLQQLRREAYVRWETINVVGGIYNGGPESFETDPVVAERLPWTNETFKTEIRKRFGDLRKRNTWEHAAIALTAQLIVQGYFEPYQIVAQIASPTYMRSTIHETYPTEVVDRVMQWPGIADVIREGLEQIYGDPVFSEERELVEQCRYVLPATTTETIAVALAGETV